MDVGQFPQAVGSGVFVGVGASVGAWAVMVATMDLAMAVLVAETLGVGAGVDPQAAMKIAMRTRGNSFFMFLSFGLPFDRLRAQLRTQFGYDLRRRCYSFQKCGKQAK
jgi:hypothetical protein